jgi:hypothetical protein
MEAVRLLMTIPGVDYLAALSLLAATGAGSETLCRCLANECSPQSLLQNPQWRGLSTRVKGRHVFQQAP